MDTSNGLTTAGASLLEALRRYRVAVIGAVLIGATAGYAAAVFSAPMYEGVARLHLEDPGASAVFDAAQPAADPSRHARNQAALLVADPVLQAAAPDVAVEELRDRVSAQASTSLDVIEVRASAATPEEAAELANAVAGAYRAAVTTDVQRRAEAAAAQLATATEALQGQVAAAEQAFAAEPDNAALEARRDAAVAQLITVQGRAEQIAVDAALHGDGVGLFQPAAAPAGAAGPGPALTAIAGALVGLLAAAAIAWIVAERRQRADHRSDPARVLGVPLLGDVPAFAETDGTLGPALDDPSSPAAEAFQFIAASVELALADADGRTVLVTSARAGEGKTATALNLAVAAASDGRRVVVVDGDDRARGLSIATGGEDAPGLTDITGDSPDLAETSLALPTGRGHAVRVVPAGHPVADPAGYYRSPAFRRALRLVRDDADLVVLDSPPLLAVADTTAIASQVDGVVLVVDRGTPLRSLVEARDRLALVGTPLLGYVFNRDDARGERQSYRATATTRPAAVTRATR